jgi:hypothetical protein
MKKLLVFVLLLAAGAGAAYHFGYLDRLIPGGLGGARLIPKDPKLLAYFRPDTRELLVVQLTELDFRLSGESKTKLEQDWREFYEKTGINVRSDVDAVAGSDGLGVARGRFDWGKLGPYLQSQGYTLTELSGVPAAVKPLAVDVALDGNYLLAGPRAELEQAIARKQKGQGLDDSSPIVKALDDIGWRHGLVGGVVTGSRLSSVGPADLKLPTVMGALDSTRDGIELRAVAVTTSKEEGEALHSMLEMLRKTALLQMAITTQPEVRTLRDSLERATLEVDKQGRVTGAISVPYAMVDQASANLSAQSLAPTPQALALADESEASAPTPPPSTPPPSTPSTPPAKEDSAPPAPAPVTSAAVSHSLDWKPPVFGVILLVIALVTMGAATRPGMFNVLFHPLFLLPFLVATLGVFVFRWTGHSGGAFDVLALPMPEWHRFVSFPVAQTIALSAAIPMLLAIISGPVSLLRRVAAGLAVGFSAYLAAKALGGASLPLIPPAYTVIWYAGNAVAALLLARLTIPPRRSKQSAAPPRGPAR